MKFKLEIDMNKAAFDDDPFDELGRILTTLAKAHLGTMNIKLRDQQDYKLHMNGNTVGTATVIREEE